MIPLRDENPASTAPAITLGLIATCLLVFVWQTSLSQRGSDLAVMRLGMIPAVLFEHVRLPPGLHPLPTWVTVITSMFMHGGFMHLAGNMLYLWIFGDNVEDSMGHGRFLAFYLLCGIAAAATQGFIDPYSRVPMIGASGAISGVLGAYVLMYPRARVLVLVPLGIFTQLLHLPALAVLGLWFLLQIASSLFTHGGQGGVAFYAHIGGFIAGLAMIPSFRRPTTHNYGNGLRDLGKARRRHLRR